jgi:hypothetical protein
MWLESKISLVLVTLHPVRQRHHLHHIQLLHLQIGLSLTSSGRPRTTQHARRLAVRGPPQEIHAARAGTCSTPKAPPGTPISAFPLSGLLSHGGGEGADLAWPGARRRLDLQRGGRRLVVV